MIAPILPLLTEAQVADLLGLSIRTLQAWRLNGGGPPFVRLADDGRRGTIRYRQVDISAFIERRALLAPDRVVIEDPSSGALGIASRRFG